MLFQTWIVVIVLACSLLACSDVPQASTQNQFGQSTQLDQVAQVSNQAEPQPDQASASADSTLSLTVVDAGTTRCLVRTVVASADQPLDLAVTLTGGAGLQLFDGANVAAISSGPQNATLFADAERTLVFPCRTVGANGLAGVYAVRATAVDRRTGAVKMAAQTVAAMQTDDDGVMRLTDRPIWSSYRQGGLGVGYGFDERAADAASGTLLLIVDGTSEPVELTLEINEPLRFVDSVDASAAVQVLSDSLALVRLPPMQEGERRLVRLGVQVASGQGDGRHRLKVTRGDAAEIAPLALRVERLDGGSELSFESADARPIAPTRVVLPSAGVGGGEPQSLLPPTSSSPATGRSADATVTWEGQLIGYGGTLADLWQNNLEHQVAGAMDFQQFATEMRRYNPHIMTDGDALHPSKSYRVPLRNDG